MLGAGLQLGRSRGEDRFYIPAKARRNHHLNRAQSDVNVVMSPVMKEKRAVSENVEPENRAVSDEPRIPVALPALEPVVSPLSNLERFVESITPSVPAQHLSKRTTRVWRTCDAELQPYFVLGDLWESFKEWSAYGAGVPLVLNGSDCVVQYYVPYLSGIQIYSEHMKSSVKLRRRPGEDSDGDYFRDSSSDASSDYEPDRVSQYVRDQRCHNHLSNDIHRISLRDQQFAAQEGFSSDDSDSGNSQGSLLFEYFAQERPYSREPLADKITDLAFRFPELKTLRSCDLLSSSWISVAWYPIYRIPTGPTLKDLDACFLTFHSLHTPMIGDQNSLPPLATYGCEIQGAPKISLPVFGLASYKFKESVWNSNGVCEHQFANSLLQAADNWLRSCHVYHPDYIFFSRR